MYQKSTLEEDICHLASFDEEGDNEHTAPLEEQEPIETYHVYPVPGGMMILREEEEPEAERDIDSFPPMKGTDFAGFIAVCFFILLILSSIAFQLYLAMFPVTAIVTIVPKEQTITAYGTVKIVSGMPHAGEIQGRRLPAITLSQEASTPATGKGHQNAAQAYGLITFYNGQFSSQTIPAGTVLTGSDGTQIITNVDAVIPAGNPPMYGQVTVSAHAIRAGREGNIPAFDINQACCLASVLAKNTRSFTGGQDERNFTVVAKQDIDSVSTMLKTSLTQSMQGALSAKVKESEALFNLPCTTTVTPDHRPGEEATTVNVTVSETCSGIVYDKKAFIQQAVTILSAKAEHQLGTTYNSLGDVQVTGIQTATTNNIITLTFTAQSVWVYTISPALERSLKHNIAGKTVQDALKYLSAIPGIQTVTIRGIEEDQKLPKSVSAIHFVIIS